MKWRTASWRSSAWSLRLRRDLSSFACWTSERAIVIVAAAWAIIGGHVAASLDLFERLNHLARSYERFQVDELFSILIFGSTSFLVLSLVEHRRLRAEVSRRIRAEGDARRLAGHDPLTGLPNRRSLEQHLDAHWATKRGDIHLLVIDLDRFKPVNDLHGHAAGDEVLMVIARRLSRLLEAQDGGVLARLGGDEFAYLVRSSPGCDRVERTARRIVAEIARPIDVGSARVEIGASVGIAGSGDGLSSSSELLRAADLAMYRAKQHDRSSFQRFHWQMDAEMRARASLDLELRQALRDDQVLPYFQPIVRMSDRVLMGFEMLARWRHPERGIVKPDQFVGIAEDAGLIDRMMHQLLSRACADAVTWHEELTLSINVAPCQLRNRRLAAQILHTLDSQGLSPERLVVEITEHGLIEDYATARANIAALKSEGVQVALDDFGTGSSSLIHLRELRFDRLKIDRSFVHEMGGIGNAHLVKAIVGIGRSLNIALTAEGIESEREFAMLAAIGCDFGQGHMLGVPMPAATANLVAEAAAAARTSPPPRRRA